MNKHTPTPWGVNAYGEVCQDKGEFYGLRDRVEVTGFLLTESAGNPEAAANTAHIARCVNSRDALVAERDALAAQVEELKVDLATQKYFGDLWYFVMDGCPLEFEKIVSEYPPAQWLHQAVQLRNAKKAAAGAPQ